MVLYAAGAARALRLPPVCYPESHLPASQIRD